MMDFPLLIPAKSWRPKRGFGLFLAFLFLIFSVAALAFGNYTREDPDEEPVGPPESSTCNCPNGNREEFKQYNRKFLESHLARLDTDIKDLLKKEGSTA